MHAGSGVEEGSGWWLVVWWVGGWGIRKFVGYIRGDRCIVAVVIYDYDEEGRWECED